MRLFLAIITSISILFATEAKQKVTIGACPYIQSQPYKGASELILPSPIVFYDNGLFYIRWSRLGIYFLGDKQDDYAWGFSLTAQPRTLGLQGK